MAQRRLAFLRTVIVLPLAAALAFVAGCASDSANLPVSSLQIHMGRRQKTPGCIPMRVPGEPDTVYVFPDAAITGMDIKDVYVVTMKRAGALTMGGIRGNMKGRSRKGRRATPKFHFAVAITFTRAGAKRLARAIKAMEGEGSIGAVPVVRGDEQRGASKNGRGQMRGQRPTADDAAQLAWKRQRLGEMKDGGLVPGGHDLRPFATGRPEGGTAQMPGFAVGRLAFIVGGRLVIAPPFKGEIGRNMLISGDFSQQEAGRICGTLKGSMGASPTGFVPPPLQAAPEEPQPAVLKTRGRGGGTPYQPRRGRKRKRPRPYQSR